MRKAFFITGTDTNVGKTITTAALGVLFQQQGYSVGVMKPVQCAGDDSLFLKETLNLDDSLEEINPYFVNEPLSPHIAFKRAKKTISSLKIIRAFHHLQKKYDIVLIEGAGGLMVPLIKNYFVVDLVRDLNAELIIVSRLGLGTINHTLLTITQAQQEGLNVGGVIFSEDKRKVKGVPEKTNPEVIAELGKVDVLGTIPYLKDKNRQDIIKQCEGKISLTQLLNRGESKTRTAQLQEDDQKYIWHPFTQMKDWLNDTPLVIDQAKGCYLIDSNGNRYLDGVSSLWVNVHGHRHPTIDKAIKDQVNRLSHSTLLGLANTPSIELAKELIEIAPRGLAKVFYSDNGSTSVEIAIKMAYQYWQNMGEVNKTKIVHLNHSYHGDTLGSVSVGGIDLFHKVYRHLIFETIQADFCDCYRAPKGRKYPDYAFECVDKIEQMFEANHKSIAAFVVEPIVQGAAGMIIWPKGVLKRMSEICRKHDIFLIADEVATGFGRTGTMFACQQENVSPDFMCIAKGITGGYLPLAATLTTQKVFDGFLFDYRQAKTFFHGHTYTGNPLACAAALANLGIFENEKTLVKLQPKIKLLAKRLQMFYNLPLVGDVRQQGFMVGIELVKNRLTTEPFLWEERIGAQVCQEARKYGVILRPLGNVIVLMPPLAISIEQLDKILDVTYKAIETITKKYD